MGTTFPNIFLSSKGNCTVTNFDSRKRNFEKNSNDIKINFKDGSCGIPQEGSNSAKLHSVGDLLGMVAELDGNKTELSYDDFKQLKQMLKDGEQFVFSLFGIKTVRSDDAASVASVIFKDGTMVRVDFDKNIKKATKPSIFSTTKQSQQVQQTQQSQTGQKVQQSKQTQSVKTTAPSSRTSKTEKLPKAYENGIIQAAAKMNTSVDNLKQKIKETAQKTGFSEYLISHIVSLENFEPYVVFKDNDGTLTGGFGHTNLKDPSLVKGKKVTAEMAFKWLVQDIKDFEKEIKSIKLKPDEKDSKTIGDYYNQLPRSIKEAMIDIAFNRGPGRLKHAPEYEHLMANIAGGKENLPAIAVRLRQEFFTKQGKYKTYEQLLDIDNKKANGPGLMKRNVYRFLLAIRDLSEEYQELARKKFDTDYATDKGNTPRYFTWAKKMQVDKGYTKDAKYLQEAWNGIN